MLWFEKSNKYVVVDERFNLLLSLNETNSNFINVIKDKLKISLTKSKEISKELDIFFEECNLTKIKEKNIIDHVPVKCAITKTYEFNEISIEVCFDTNKTQQLIAPKFEHLIIPNNLKPKENFKIFNHNKKIYIFKNNICINGWDNTQMHEFQGKFSMELISSFHEKTENDWMGVFHASTVCKDGSGIIFTGDSGNGKSTLISILMANGFDIIADDFTPILAEDLCSYSFPSAISVKEKSFEMLYTIFPDLKKTQSHYISDIKGNVKYLTPSIKQTKSKSKIVVCVKYDKNSKNSIREISKAKALNQFLPDAWISETKINANAFINWIKESTFYELKYSDNKKAICYINQLIN